MPIYLHPAFRDSLAEGLSNYKDIDAYHAGFRKTIGTAKLYRSLLRVGEG